jgi:peptidoglycan/xylan/chitin deacetylase (PgdA/CDA1 family)
MYHRVNEAGPDPWGLAVSPRHFTEHLQVLRRETRPVALRDLPALRARKRGPRPCVALTFDDGYADNVLTALPLLREHDIPATVFVATAHLGKQRGFWWDQLADLLLRPGRLPATLELTVNGRDFHWSLGASVEYSEQAYNRNSRWAAIGQEPPTERQALYFALWELLLPLADEEQRRLLETLEMWAGASPIQEVTHRMLSEDELISLGNDDLIEIGAHSVTHAVLPSLSVEAQRREVVESKRVLEELTDNPVTSFSYPYGRHSEPTLSVVRDAGFERACGTRPARVTAHGNAFDLPRISVPDCDGEEFARMLSHVHE